jgi:LPXTG-motif cell wall-anchored protein
MRRLLLLGLLLGMLLAVATAAGAQVSPDATTTTVPDAATGGNSPWLLVLIGASAGAVVGVLTGLARRRRAETGRRS